MATRKKEENLISVLTTTTNHVVGKKIEDAESWAKKNGYETKITINGNHLKVRKGRFIMVFPVGRERIVGMMIRSYAYGLVKTAKEAMR